MPEDIRKKSYPPEDRRAVSSTCPPMVSFTLSDIGRVWTENEWDDHNTGGVRPWQVKAWYHALSPVEVGHAPPSIERN
jgi:hypothetical protein